jgi:methionine-rich copper-binding protein CopC
MNRATVTLLLLAFSPLPRPAWAHAQLVSAQPRVGATVARAPAEIVLRFSESPEPRFSNIEVRDAAGTRVDRQDLRLGPDGDKTLAVGLPSLPPGTYLVRWQVLSVDTHRTEGSFRFTVAP